MLRITSRVEGAEIVLELEGKLAGPWVMELENCWREIGIQNQRLRVNLKSVTFVDSAGTKLLQEMHSNGTLLEAYGCMTRAIVADIQRRRSRNEKL